MPLDEQMLKVPKLQLSSIPHYYGNIVRTLFVVVAVVSAFTIPVWGDLLPIGTFTQVAGIVILVVLAGLTNPHGDMIMWANTVVSALGVLLLENAAISYYDINEIVLFLTREILVILLLIALYYSLKTVRAIATHKLGHSAEVGEFDDHE